MNDSERKPKAPSDRKRALFVALRLLALGLAIVFVARQVEWNDRAHLPNGTVIEGRVQEESSEETLILRPTDGGSDHHLARGDWEATGLKLGLYTVTSRLRPSRLAFGLLLILGMYCASAWRWWGLVRAVGLKRRFPEILRLTFVGFFSNNLLPGNAGGDLMKAVGVARGVEGYRVLAISTVFFDRIMGLIMFVVIAAIATMCGESTLGQLSSPAVALAILAFCGAGFVFATRRIWHVPFRPVAQWGLMGQIIGHLADLTRPYRSAPLPVAKALLIGAFGHVLTIATFVVFGQELGIDAPLMRYAFVVPCALVAAALPVSPGGWGVREAAFVTLFLAGQPEGPPASSVVVLSLLWGFANVAASLFGAPAFLLKTETDASSQKLTTSSAVARVSETVVP